MKTSKLSLLFVLLLLLFVGCGKEDDTPNPEPDPVQEEPDQEEPDDTNEPTVLTGVFKDGAVEGLNFETATQSGRTNANGEFSYVEGETVTFKIGDLVLGSALGQELVTPITLAQTLDANATIESPESQNIAAFLQTLDLDGDESNGITISEDLANNIGISTLDFSQPIEAVLADIVVNIGQSLGLALNVVYPSEAANNMATSLGISFSAPENLVVSHFINGIQPFFQTWDYAYTSTSAIYKTTFNADGTLQTVEVVARYSGKVFYKAEVNSLNANGLPESILLTTYGANSLKGTFSATNTTNENLVQLSYNGSNQISVIGFVVPDGSRVDNNYITAHDTANRPLSYFRDFAEEDPTRDFTITWNLTYNNDLIATAERIYNDQRADNSSFYSRRNFTYTYNDQDNISLITYDRLFEDNFFQNGELVFTSLEASITDSFEYDSNNKLVSYVESQQGTTGDGVSFSSTSTYTYDQNEVLTLNTYESSNGQTGTTNYQNGVQTTSETFNNGQLTYENENFADGSSITTSYWYDENGLISYKEITEFGVDSIQGKRKEYYFEGNLDFYIIEEYNGYQLAKATEYLANDQILSVSYYNDLAQRTRLDVYFDGVLNYYIEYEYDVNGFVTTEYSIWPDGEVYGVRNFTYNEFGFTSIITYAYPDGTIYLTEEFEYDANFFMSRLTGYGQNGNVSYILFYEDGVLVREEIYDENGNLVDVIDYTTTGKSAISTSRYLQSKFQSKNGGNIHVLEVRESLRTQRNVASKMFKNKSKIATKKVNNTARQ